jgi:hypothetical protein
MRPHMCTTMEAFHNGREGSMRATQTVVPGRSAPPTWWRGSCFVRSRTLIAPPCGLYLTALLSKSAAVAPAPQIPIADQPGLRRGDLHPVQVQWFGTLSNHALHQRHRVHGLPHEVPAKPARTHAEQPRRGYESASSGRWARPQEARSVSSAQSVRPGRPRSNGLASTARTPSCFSRLEIPEARVRLT